jgi:hypothetical protein
MATKKQTPATSAPDKGSEQANIAGATEFDPSGAPIQTVSDIDPSHPAVDDNPRKGTTVDQNRIDFNDPTKTGAEAVVENLREQGQDVKAEASEDQKQDE